MDTSGILCVGALNHDTVAIGTVPPSVVDLIRSLGPYRPYTETLVPDHLAEEILSVVVKGGLETTDQLGGSAYNVMRVLAPFSSHLRLGYLGIAGHIDGRYSHLEFLNERAIETNFVELLDEPAARSIAFSADGDRTLFTSGGANRSAAASLDRRRYAIVPYLASFDIVHVTSFLDLATPDLLAELVSDALELNPELVVSVDPGHHWSVAPSPGVEKLLRTASLLHLNSLEFESLGGRVGNEPDEQVVARVREMMRSGSGRRLLIRRHDSVLVYVEDELGRAFQATVENDDVVPASDVLDATGAGDAFTGGVLAVLASPVLQFLIGTRIGTTLAQTKVRQRGPLNPERTVAAVERVIGKLPMLLTGSPDGNDTVQMGRDATGAGGLGKLSPPRGPVERSEAE